MPVYARRSTGAVSRALGKQFGKGNRKRPNAFSKEAQAFYRKIGAQTKYRGYMAGQAGAANTTPPPAAANAKANELKMIAASRQGQKPKPKPQFQGALGQAQAGDKPKPGRPLPGLIGSRQNDIMGGRQPGGGPRPRGRGGGPGKQTDPGAQAREDAERKHPFRGLGGGFAGVGQPGKDKHRPPTAPKPALPTRKRSSISTPSNSNNRSRRTCRPKNRTTSAAA